MIIVTCRIYPKNGGLLYKKESHIFDDSHQLRKFLIEQGNVIVDKVFELKEENNG